MSVPRASFPHAVRPDNSVGCEASSLDKRSVPAWCGPQVDTLLRTAYELQDGLARSAGHGRRPLPSPEQARQTLHPTLTPHSCLAITQLLTVHSRMSPTPNGHSINVKQNKCMGCCAAPATPASCCPTQASMPRSPVSLWSYKVRAALLALMEVLSLGMIVGTRATNHLWEL